MSRFTGPRLRVMRALGVDLPGLSRKTIESRQTPPGQHGAKAGRRRKTDFGIKLREKQKLRFNYGVSERQLRRLMLAARRSTGPTGEALLQLLERRLDNVVFRAGFAPTILAARQLVSHRHIRLNGKTVNIPSLLVKVGDEVTLKPESMNLPIVLDSIDEPPLTRPEWLSWDEDSKTGKVAHFPSAEEIPFPIEVQQVVEYYASRI
ncbi:MAG: 30S ribosomal protein S4 [Gammaproteobacteria bacterium]|nr:30S ribosomal protein S4 [Gammaproteobacteria bacterium]